MRLRVAPPLGRRFQGKGPLLKLTNTSFMHPPVRYSEIAEDPYRINGTSNVKKRIVSGSDGGGAVQ
jgi:hypothetical protein